jgi:hypothetical protein
VAHAQAQSPMDNNGIGHALDIDAVQGLDVISQTAS